MDPQSYMIVPQLTSNREANSLPVAGVVANHVTNQISVNLSSKQSQLSNQSSGGSQSSAFKEHKNVMIEVKDLHTAAKLGNSLSSTSSDGMSSDATPNHILKNVSEC